MNIGEEGKTLYIWPHYDPIPRRGDAPGTKRIMPPPPEDAIAALRAELEKLGYINLDELSWREIINVYNAR